MNRSQSAQPTATARRKSSCSGVVRCTLALVAACVVGTGCTSYHAYTISVRPVSGGNPCDASVIGDVREAVRSFARRSECGRRDPANDARGDWQSDLLYLCYGRRDPWAYDESVVWLFMSHPVDSCRAEVGLSEWGMLGESRHLEFLRREIQLQIERAVPGVTVVAEPRSNGWFRP